MSRIDDQAAEWVSRRYGGTLDAAAEAEFQRWHDGDTRHAGAYLRAEALWVMLDRTSVMTHGNIKHGIATPRRTEPNRRTFIVSGIAASIAAVVGIGYLFNRRQVWTTGVGELRNIPLTDGSVAVINTDSHIEVAMTSHLRQIDLKRGEAWFDVAKNPNAPFVVSAGDIRVRAVGTAFSVRRRSSGADILITEGVVETWHVARPAQRKSVPAGNRVFVAQDSGDIAAAFAPDEVTRALAWRERQIILRQDTLADAVAEFNRYNTQKIEISDKALASAPLVGGFRVDQPETFARAVHVVLRVPVSIEPDYIRIGTRRQSG